MKLRLKTFLLLTTLALAHYSSAQSFSNDFENQNEWLTPWLNIHIATDGDSLSGNHICRCEPQNEFGLGFSFAAGTNHPGQNIKLRYGFDFKTPDTVLQTLVVFSIDGGSLPYWNAIPLKNFLSDSSSWSQARFETNLPSDHIGTGEIKCYLWNNGQNTLLIDNAQLEIEPFHLPSYFPKTKDITKQETGISPDSFIPVVEYLDANGDTISDPSVIESRLVFDNREGHITVKTEVQFKKSVKLLRLAYLLPLPEGEITVYRRNQHIDSTNLQPSYYLDREGFIIKHDSLSLSTYHNTGISSLQLNAENRTACFNINYWRDHPLIHYPMRADTSDLFEDISYREIKQGEMLQGEFNLFINKNLDEIPRLLPVWDGYPSAFIFTEHADWADLRTHRAVLFGNEHITKPEEATGGFCYFDIPVTKSVFYWNPDQVTNHETSNGLFSGLHATIKTDKDFYKLLKAIKKKGFEICLHSPEQYTTVPSAMPKAIRFMKQQFGSVSWIDHGYNNGPDKNREDMVCDGLLPDSPFYAADLWRKNGVRYLWNAYYEENSMESLNFYSQFIQPYDGFGDAIPNRQITTLPNGDKDFLLWSTPSTLEVNDDSDWYYYFDSIRLQQLVNQHNVFITHIYPAWTNPSRGFWQLNENGTIVTMPGFNFALSQLARLRDEKKLLPTTIEKYLGHYEKLLNIEYNILNDNSIQITNNGPSIEGLTLLCTKPISIEGKNIHTREVKEGYLVWFDLGRNETVNIKYRE